MASQRAALILLAILLGVGAAQAFTAPEGDALIKHFLASKKTPDLDPSESGKALVDLNGGGKPELVLVWTQLGPTYFYNHLTVFIDEGRKYRALTTPLTGEAKLLGEQVKYRWDGKKIQ